MSEHAPQHSPEHLHKPESKEHEQRLHEQLEKRASEALDNKEKVGELAHQATEQATSTDEIKVGETGAQQPSSQYVGQQLKNLSFERTMTRIRRQLSSPDKALSKVVHQPVVQAVSRVGEQTIARPSGLLGGSICAFVGSCVFLWASKHYGFRYNYLMFLLFFVVGFAFGLGLELATYGLRKRRPS